MIWIQPIQNTVLIKNKLYFKYPFSKFSDTKADSGLHYLRGSQPVVRVPQVVREQSVGGTQKPILQFLLSTFDQES